MKKITSLVLVLIFVCGLTLTATASNPQEPQKETTFAQARALTFQRLSSYLIDGYVVGNVRLTVDYTADRYVHINKASATVANTGYNMKLKGIEIYTNDADPAIIQIHYTCTHPTTGNTVDRWVYEYIRKSDL